MMATPAMEGIFARAQGQNASQFSFNDRSVRAWADCARGLVAMTQNLHELTRKLTEVAEHRA